MLSPLPLVAVVAASLATLVSAQTPTGSWPRTDKNLGVDFNGTKIVPGVLLSSAVVTNEPRIYTRKPLHADVKHMVFMLDLSIPDSDVTANTSAWDTLVPGIAANRTTRLHWWQGNLTQQQQQPHHHRRDLFVNHSEPLSQYTSPRPREGDIAHYYTLYLFEQPADFVPSQAALDGVYYSQMANARFNFSLASVVQQAGEPVAANYFLSSYNASVGA